MVIETAGNGVFLKVQEPSFTPSFDEVYNQEEADRIQVLLNSPQPDPTFMEWTPNEDPEIDEEYVPLADPPYALIERTYDLQTDAESEDLEAIVIDETYVSEADQYGGKPLVTELAEPSQIADSKFEMADWKMLVDGIRRDLRPDSHISPKHLGTTRAHLAWARTKAATLSRIADEESLREFKGREYKDKNGHQNGHDIEPNWQNYLPIIINPNTPDQ